MVNMMEKTASLIQSAFSWARKALCYFKVRLLLITLLIVATTLMFCFFLTYQINIRIMQNQDEQSTLTSFRKSEENIEWFLSNVERVSLSLQLTEPVQSFLYDERQDAIQYIEVQHNLINQIDAVISTYNYLNAVIFFKTNGEMGGSSSPRTYFTSGRHPFYSTTEYREASAGQTRMSWVSGYMRDFFTLYPIKIRTQKDIMIVGLRTLGDQAQDMVKGDGREPRSNVMLVSVSEPAFRQFFDNLADKGTSVSVLDQTGKQISGTAFSQFGKVPSYYQDIASGSDYGSFTTNRTEKESQIIYYRMNRIGWTLVKEIPLKIYSAGAVRIRNIMMFVFAGTLFVIILVYTLWVLRFFKPFEELTKSMYSVGQGKLSTRIAVKSGIYEIGLINNAFNDMIRNLDRLIVRNKEMDKEKRELEFKNLQDQINPHFLYNTITSIRWMAMLSGAKNVDNALISLVRLLRPVFNSNEIVWTLREELDYIENYIDLMKLRHGGNIDFTVTGQREYPNLKLPRFILQPILENCFQHAIAGTDGSLKIRLSVRENQDRYELVIEDNGSGIEDEVIVRLNSLFESEKVEQWEEDQDHTRIGLYNVNRRLKLRYGPESGLKIDRNFKEGARIFINLVKKEYIHML